MTTDPFASHWRSDASPAQLLRAARGLEAIADTCAGPRRTELMDLVEDLRDRAWSRRATDLRRSRPLAPATLA